MSHTKTFEYEENGLSYTITVYEVNGAYFADITVNEGAMDVNAVYYGDDEFSGSSASLSGPLNMNGGGSQYEGETVQWDGAVKLSDPGLSGAGTDKETFISEGETLTVALPISSLDDIDFVGIRATSTTTDEGSIKGVSGDPETEDPEEPTYEKVFFNYGPDAGGTDSGYYILAEEPEDNPFNVPALPEGTDPTFANYLAYFEELGGDVTQVQSVVFYETDDEGVPQELFTLDAPEGGFADADALLAAYDEATEGMAEDLELIASLTIEADPDDELIVEEDEDPAQFAVL